MNISDLDYQFPEELIATQPSDQFRTLLVNGAEFKEISKKQIFELFQPGDVLVINETRVQKRRVFAEADLEVLFVRQIGPRQWEVLYPSKAHKVGDTFDLPGGLTATLARKGLPQVIELSKEMPTDYFSEHGDLALPPYIQKKRAERRSGPEDEDWYQTEWARVEGSAAAPTASLHFSKDELEALQGRGVEVVPVILHVGLGTFLPMKSESCEEHKMHSEEAFISSASRDKIQNRKGRCFALGTTVARTLEAWANNHLSETSEGLAGATDLFIYPPYKFKTVDVLMTNFHQPKSTLLAMVCAFAGEQNTKKAYQFAVENRFRLFSYGDFSVWMPSASRN